jgi:hypothetical protein
MSAIKGKRENEMIKTKWQKLIAGHYGTWLNGHRLEVIEHRHYRGLGGPIGWNIVIDGCCDDAALTKREAQEQAVIAYRVEQENSLS